MDEKDIEGKLRDIIKPYIGDEDAFKSLSRSTNLLSDLKINSAHLVDVILDTEEVFDIEIDDENAEKMLTVQAAVEIITQKLNEK